MCFSPQSYANIVYIMQNLVIFQTNFVHISSASYYEIK
jgi:hypothetical protein